MNRCLAALAAVVIGIVIGAPHAGAQNRIADSLLRRGALDRAESEYYRAVRARPRDASARYALGRYLIERGALRTGATLVDEAMQFGFDKQIAGATLAAVYMDLGEYHSIETLPASPLAPNDAAFLRWLVAHPSRAIAPDSTILAAFARTTVEGFVGSTRIRVNGQPLVAMIAPRAGCGIRISDTAVVAGKLHRFPSSDGTARAIPAAADSLGLGRMTVTNVPVSIEPLREGAQAVVCFGWIGRYAPTFDPRAGLATLRLGGRAPEPASAAIQVPMRAVDSQWAVLQGGGWAPLVLPQVSSLLRDRRWTFDLRRGLIAIDP